MMRKQVTFKLFTIHNALGDALKASIIQCLKELEMTLDEYEFVCSEYDETQGVAPSRVLFQSVVNNEIVVIDGSLEVNNGKFGSNYECFTPTVMNFDNVIIVSLTQIPLNILPTRTNVKRLGEEYDLVNPNNSGRTSYQLEYSNAQIVEWFKNEIIKMDNNQRLARPEKLKINLSLPLKEWQKQEYAVIEENVSALSKERKTNKVRCFISYRNYYYNHSYVSESGDRYCIDTIKKEIDRYHNGNAEFIYFRPGILSNELMPEIRRWMFLSYTDRTIRDCDEFWIFDTKYNGEDTYGYWDSWWCLGEALTILRMKNSSQIKPDFKVMKFSPDATGNKIGELDISKWHNLTQKESRELARYYSNADILQAGFENIAAMRYRRKLPKCLLKLQFKMLEYATKQIAMPGKFADQELNFTFEEFLNSVYAHVYDKAFFENRILIDKPQCGNTIDIILDGKEKNMFVWNFLNINGWYFEHNFKEKEWYGIEKPKGIRIITDKDLNINTQTEDYFYIYWMPKFGKYTGPNDSIIETVNLYTKDDLIH